MKKAFIILTVVVLLTSMMVAGVACGKAKEGELPAYEIGDEWVAEMVIDNVNYTITTKVVSMETINNKDCYVFHVLFNPPLHEVFSTGKAWAAKSEPYFAMVKGQMEGTYMDMPCSVVIETSVEYPEGLPWPLEIGKEFKIIETTTTTSTMVGETTTETETETTIWKVEDKEDVTVLAGEFSCFKIGKYNEEGTLLDTWWYSDKVKMDVKTLDAITGETLELKSFSVS